MASEIKVDTISEKTSAGGVTIDGLLIKDGGISGDVSLIGTTPTFTIGDAGAEDATLLFDGNAQDFHIGLDDTADDLVIGVGSTLGTTTAIAIDENTNTTFSGTVTVGVDDTGKDVKFFGATASRYWLWDESADGVVQRGTLTVGVDDTGHDVKLFGATASSYMLWDESADDLNLIASGLGVGTAKDLGVGVHIRTADSGADVHNDADELVIENSATGGITILSGTSTEGRINFGDSGDNDIGRVNYSHSGNYMTLYTNAAIGLKIDSAGAVTKPLQPCFHAYPSSNQDNFAVASDVTVVFGSERFDLGGDFASNTFTAPATGKYILQCNLRVGNLDKDSNEYMVLKLVTSNVTYSTMDYFPMNAGFSSDLEHLHMGFTVVADMDASDTAYVQIRQQGGSAQADVRTDYSYFSGVLVA